MDDEEIRLVLQTAGFDAMAGIASNAQLAAQSYQVLAIAGEGFEVEERRVASAMDLAVQSAVEQTQAQKALNRVLEETTRDARSASSALASAGGSGSQAGRALQTTAFAVQDFTSQLGTRGLAGALSAVQNNIPGFVTQVGGTAGMAGAVGLAAVSLGLLYENWDKLAALWEQTEKRLPTLSQGLEGLSKSIKAIDAEIETLESKGDDWLDAHLPARDRLRKLRDRRKEAAGRAADIRLTESIGENESAASKALVAAVRTAIAEAGGGASVADNLKGNLGGEYHEAAAVVAGALRGNTTDLDQLRKFAPTFGREFDKVDPIALAARADREKKAKADEAARAQEAEDAHRRQADLDEYHARLVKSQTDGAARAARESEKRAADARRASERRARESTPEAALNRFHNDAYGSALQIGLDENNGEFGPGDLKAIARRAADDVQSLDPTAIRQAVYQAAAMTRARNQAQLDRAMRRLYVPSDSFVSPYD